MMLTKGTWTSDRFLHVRVSAQHPAAPLSARLVSASPQVQRPPTLLQAAENTKAVQELDCLPCARDAPEIGADIAHEGVKVGVVTFGQVAPGPRHDREHDVNKGVGTALPPQEKKCSGQKSARTRA